MKNYLKSLKIFIFFLLLFSLSFIFYKNFILPIQRNIHNIIKQNKIPKNIFVIENSLKNFYKNNKNIKVYINSKNIIIENYINTDINLSNKNYLNNIKKFSKIFNKNIIYKDNIPIKFLENTKKHCNKMLKEFYNSGGNIIYKYYLINFKNKQKILINSFSNDLCK